MAVDSIKGDISLADGNGSAGPATIMVNTNGYQSIGLDSLVENSYKWVVEMYDENGDLRGVVSSDSANASRTARVNPPDGGNQYGNAMWFRQLVPVEEVGPGDRWVIYGWQGTPETDEYPPDREYLN